LRREREALLGVLAVLLVGSAVVVNNVLSGPGTDTEETSSEANLSAVVEGVEEGINRARTDEGTPPLEADGTRGNVSAEHSACMARRGNLSEVGADGLPPGERVRDAGYVCERGVAQNTLRLNHTGLTEEEAASAVVDAFLSDNSTRRTITDERREEHGVGLALRGDDLYVTQTAC